MFSRAAGTADRPSSSSSNHRKTKMMITAATPSSSSSCLIPFLVTVVAVIAVLPGHHVSAASYYSAPDYHYRGPVTGSQARSAAAPFGVPAQELNKYVAAVAEEDEDTEGVVIEAPKASTRARVAESTTPEYHGQMQNVEEQSIAQSQPGGIALAGPGGVASAAPRATALVGKAGLAISSPHATAVAGTKDMVKKQTESLGLKRKLSPTRY